ncbi:hypothetical protein TcBrA4_0055420 [Trypanosoma cruzi]|nr:hypothetical protein TcBrA4_0055420 [Trypanosoma cruzi]
MRTTPSRGWPGLPWIDGGPDRKNSDRCCAERAEFMDKRRPLATCAPQKVSQDKKERQKTARGRPPLMKADDGGHTHSATHHQTPQKTSHRTADASSDRPNCPTRSTKRAEGAARETCAPPTREQRMPPAGQFTAFRRTHEQPINEESRAALFYGNIRCGAADPTAARQDAAVHVANGSNPAGHDDYGATKTSGEIGEETGAPFDKGGGGSICPQPEPDGTITLDWSGAPRTAKADPHRASRFVGIRGQDAFDTIKLCRTLQENEKLTNLTTARVERALVPWNATAHSIKRGALRHAAPIVETHDLDPHVISQLAVHVDPFDLSQNTV